MADPSGASTEQLIEQIQEVTEQLRGQVGRIVVGQDRVIQQVFISLFTRGHALLVGVPGLAKTLLVSTIARSLSLQFSRIQFTPDLMPSDITGTEVIEEDKASGQRRLRFVKGPVFANVILADEINRTPPKTQAALLEAMQEHHVTAGGMQHALPQPFFVLATQNPIEQEGTYPLPEAQLDRFMFMIRVGYPTEEEELDIVRRTTSRQTQQVEPVVTADQVLQIQELVRDVPVADHVVRYALRLARATRTPGRGESDHRPESIRNYLSWGAGPRASQNLVLAAKARAIMDRRTHVVPEDVAAVAPPVLRHRLVPNFAAEADGVTTDDIIDRLLESIQPGAASDAQADVVLR
jgi:MoxR-like ATPase